jgi:hypothetical protein
MLKKFFQEQYQELKKTEKQRSYWRELSKFLILLGASIGGFFIFVLLHNGFYALGTITNHIVVLSHLIEALSVVSFCIAVLLCPPAFLVGAAGSIARAINRWKKQTAG